ncbi:mitogen-activated protein kinase kinase kinase [Savitreella phatthalungensis]
MDFSGIPSNIDDVSALEQELASGPQKNGSPYPSLRSGQPTSPGARKFRTRQERIVSDPADVKLDTSAAAQLVGSQIAAAANAAAAVGGTPAGTSRGSIATQNSQQASSPLSRQSPPSVDASVAHWKAVRQQLDARQRTGTVTSPTLISPAPANPGLSSPSFSDSPNSPAPVDRRDHARRISAALTSPAISRHSHAPIHANTRPISAASPDLQFDPNLGENWTRERVQAWLQNNGFGQDWQETFAQRGVEGDGFLQLTSYLNVRKVTPATVHGSDAPARLCNAIRKLLEKQDPGHALITGNDAASAFTRTPPAESHTKRNPWSTERFNDSTMSLASEADLQVADEGTHLKDRPVPDPKLDRSTALKRSHRKSRSADIPTLESLRRNSSEYVRELVGFPGSGDPQPRRRIVQVTRDHEWFIAIDISEFDKLEECREHICRKLGLPPMHADFFATEIGEKKLGQVLTENDLSRYCTRADSVGTTKFFLAPRVEMGTSEVRRSTSTTSETATQPIGTDDRFKVLRRQGEINFDQPRSSPYESLSSGSRKVKLSASSSLRAQRIAPKPPSTSRATPAPVSDSTAAASAAVPVQDISAAAHRQTVAAALHLERTAESSRLQPGTSTMSSLDAAGESTINSQSSTFSFEDAPTLDSSDEDEGAAAKALWAVKPTESDSSQQRQLESQSGRDSTSRVKYQSMRKPKARRSASQSSKDTRVETPRSGSQTDVTDDVPAKKWSKDGLQRSKSFARQDVWAVRPAAEALYENLQDFFPNHDLDKPIIPGRSPSAFSDESGNVSAAPKLASRMKSIRVVASEANDARKKFRAVARGIQAANRLKRRSTKVWGQRAIEVTPKALARGVLPEDSQGQASEQQQTPPQQQQPQQQQQQQQVKRTPTFRWIKGELIGKGTYGRVFLAMNAETGEMLAVKQVDLPRQAAATDARDEQQSLVETLNAEIETMRDLDHVNIVQYLGYERTAEQVSIFLEYVPGGSVGGCLRRHGKFEVDVIRSLTRQTLLGLRYLHDLNILHRDLKADNLLLDLDGTCKISDFGISKRSRDVYGNDANMSMQGTIFWMAPEVIQTRKQGYSAKIDIWSLGCVVLEMFAGRRPWSNEEAIAVLYTLGKGVPPPIPEDVEPLLSDDARDFLNQCFGIDPADRPTADALLRHPFTQDMSEFSFGETKLGLALSQT